MPVTFAPVRSASNLPSSLLTASTSANSITPFSCAVRSILNFSPGETRYCLPPVRITAYITKPLCARHSIARTLHEFIACGFNQRSKSFRLSQKPCPASPEIAAILERCETSAIPEATVRRVRNLPALHPEHRLHSPNLPNLTSVSRSATWVNVISPQSERNLHQPQIQILSRRHSGAARISVLALVLAVVCSRCHPTPSIRYTGSPCPLRPIP